MKRGLGVKETMPSKAFPVEHQDAVPDGDSFSANSSEMKSTSPPRFQLWRGYEEWTLRGYILAFVSILSIFALSGSFMFAHSMGGSPKLFGEVDTNPHPKFTLSDHDSSAFKSAWERSGLIGEGNPGKATSGSSRPAQDSLNSINGDADGYPSYGDGGALLGCNQSSANLKLFMYDLPPEFHYGMLAKEAYTGGQIWPKNVSDIPPYLGGLYQQHSPEYWLTSDLLTSNMPGRQSACTAFRVSDWRSADLIYVPFFASLAYNKYTKSLRKAGLLGGELDLVGDKNQKLQEKLLKFLRQQPAWQASGGSDHILVIHHPNSMHAMRDFFRNVMFVVSDFGRYAPEVANIGKDIVAPYKHVIPTFVDDGASFEDRKTLLFFQGTIVRKQGGVIRQQLYEMLKDEQGVRFEEGTSGKGGIQSATLGMRGSKFCLNIAGDTPSSNRLFDSIASHCIPVIISDDIELPFEDELDYSEFSVFIKSTDALQKKFVINLLRSIHKDEWMRLWKRLKAVSRHFEYQHPTKPYDAVNMVWRAMARRVPTLKLRLHKQKHFSRSNQG
ncbi:hypothetical protein KC19_6G140500 [Ceratodon purpureus]|uniref:Exostosin GT47 domain-containing protein n=1 Tax=Ceratodon purpureus TaxID=3225 RepID=A0A8T0HHY2_CERPU|nr:hypothetical protein KC19_N000900 [Ceratodon purpureus]KAG0570124.1 hypothetical protein KC19_6G140500 [Ceratodon purpureus]